MQHIDTADTAMTRAFAMAGFTVPGIVPADEDDREPRHYASVTAVACEHARLHGAVPGPGEPDNRFVWNEDDAIPAVEEIVHALVACVAPDGTQLADERESLLWGFVNMLHAQAQRIDRIVDRLVPEMRTLERAQDGTEVRAVELERVTDRAHDLGNRRDAFEKMRDFAAQAYQAETGKVWRPRHGSHISQTGSSPPPPSTPATSSARARTARPARTCPREPSSPSPAARTSRTPPPSSTASTGPVPSTST